MAGCAELEDLLAKPALVDWLTVEELPTVLERCAVGHERLATVERLVHARLQREVLTLLRGGEGLLTAKQAAKRLGVSPDYVRDHGEALDIAVPLDGAVRYDPAAVDALRRQRRRMYGEDPA